MVKVSELTGPALDWAVAKCENNTRAGFGLMKRLTIHTGANTGIFIAPKSTISDGKWFKPSRSWAQGGPIIQREHIGLISPMNKLTLFWTADIGFESRFTQFDHDPLIAAMRCYVASKLGDDVEIPQELM